MELNQLERWIAWIRLIAVPFAIIHIGVTTGYPGGYELWAWSTTAVFGVGAVALFQWSRPALTGRAAVVRGVVALAFDFAVISSYSIASYWEFGTPARQLLFIPVLEGCLRFAIVGGVVVAVLTVPVAVIFEQLRSDRFDDPFHWDFVTFQLGFLIIGAVIVGWLVGQLRVEYTRAQARAAEAERLRDELGRRADLLDSVNRCARALSSSLELSEAFAAFLRELRGLLGFDRVAIVLAENGAARVMAAAGAGADETFPPGSAVPLTGTLLEDLLAGNQPVYRRELDPARYPEEADFVALGLGSRLAVPLVAGRRTIGMLSLVRTERDAFEPEEIDLLALLGRLVATAAQNIHAYEAERRTVEELRRFSTLRADFVSLVSHELRSPMAAVIGSARTLQGRWRELSPEHRDSFLALIADETDRLAALVGDVLDTSRIDSGTFGYTFGDVDMRSLVEEAVAAAAASQDDVGLVSKVPNALPSVYGDADRLRQVLANLIENAVKYSPDGEIVEVRATSIDGRRVVIDVSDRGGGIAAEDRRLIFEKFGRARGQSAKPGTGLGLYIARSITEAHGGTLDVASLPGRGSTFTLTLPSGEPPATGLN
jgi:signal transduction histidine kinase